MSRVEKFEDLHAWQKARELAKEVYRISRRPAFAKDHGLSSQIQRSAVSTMANIAEGFERGSRGEFHQFVVTAKASCAEVRSHLYAALDAGYLEQGDFQQLLSQAEELGRILGGLRSALEQQRVEQGRRPSGSTAQSSALSPQS